MGPSGFTNSFTSGEIDDNAWDRVDLQPVGKACEQALNLVIRVAGPLGKRRGFWLNGSVADPTHLARLIPFRRSVTDALILEFGNLICHVWQTNGAPLMSGMTQVSFAIPWTDTELAGLRYKQVGDVIYFRHSSGFPPQALVRTSNTSWAFNATDFINGPWLGENTDQTFTLTFTGTDESDGNPASSEGSILAGQAVSIVASKPLFGVGGIGTALRIRGPSGTSGVRGWTPGLGTPVGWYSLFNGNVYISTFDGGVDQDSLTPPVNAVGSQSDGNSTFEFRHDGSGIVLVTGVTDSTHAAGLVLRTIPVKSAQATAFFAQGAYSNLNGWPTAWPEIREERLADGATSTNLDWADLTQTAGFTPTTEDFTPGTGTGEVIDTNAIRRRVGTDGGQVMGFYTATYLVALTTTGEHLIAGSVLDEPLTPAGVTVKQLSGFGSADVQAKNAHKGLLFVARAGQTLREINIDTQQGATGEDHSFLAQHIATRGFAQIEWVPDPDNTLWIRLADGGLAAFTYHQEQQVKGFTRQQLGGGLICEDMIVMPGPGNVETLWMVARQVLGGVTKRVILMQSLPNQLAMDGALSYVGSPTTTLSGLGIWEGQTVQVVADGAWYQDLVVTGGVVTLPVAVSVANVGFTYPVYFKSLKLQLRQMIDGLLQRQRIATCLVDVKTMLCTVASDDGPGEEIHVRRAADNPGVPARRVAREVTLLAQTDSEDESRDPRIVIQEETPLDFVLYAIKPNKVVAGD